MSNFRTWLLLSCIQSEFVGLFLVGLFVVYIYTYYFRCKQIYGNTAIYCNTLILNIIFSYVCIRKIIEKNGNKRDICILHIKN